MFNLLKYTLGTKDLYSAPWDSPEEQPYKAPISLHKSASSFPIPDTGPKALTGELREDKHLDCEALGLRQQWINML